MSEGEDVLVSFDVEIPEELYNRLLPIAQDLNTTVEQLISQALTDYVKRESEKLERQEKPEPTE